MWNEKEWSQWAWLLWLKRGWVSHIQLVNSSVTQSTTTMLINHQGGKRETEWWIYDLLNKRNTNRNETSSATLPRVSCWVLSTLGSFYTSGVWISQMWGWSATTVCKIWRWSVRTKTGIYCYKYQYWSIWKKLWSYVLHYRPSLSKTSPLIVLPWESCYSISFSIYLCSLSVSEQRIPKPMQVHQFPCKDALGKHNSSNFVFM